MKTFLASVTAVNSRGHLIKLIDEQRFKGTTIRTAMSKAAVAGEIEWKYRHPRKRLTGFSVSLVKI